MKRIAVSLTALALAASAWAQVTVETKDVPKTDAVAQVVVVRAEEAPKPPAPAARKSRRTQDARHCLERDGNTAIIKCAEEFL